MQSRAASRPVEIAAPVMAPRGAGDS